MLRGFPDGWDDGPGTGDPLFKNFCLKLIYFKLREQYFEESHPSQSFKIQVATPLARGEASYHKWAKSIQGPFRRVSSSFFFKLRLFWLCRLAVVWLSERRISY